MNTCNNQQKYVPDGNLSVRIIFSEETKGKHLVSESSETLEI